MTEQLKVRHETQIAAPHRDRLRLCDGGLADSAVADDKLALASAKCE